MTKFDIKNYFERIYNVKIANVNTRIQIGERVVVLPDNHGRYTIMCIYYINVLCIITASFVYLQVRKNSLDHGI